MAISPKKRALLNRMNQEYGGSNGSTDAAKSVESMALNTAPATVQPSFRPDSRTARGILTLLSGKDETSYQASAFRSAPFFRGDVVRDTVKRELTGAEIAERTPVTPEHVAERKSFPLMDRGTGLPRVRTTPGAMPKGCRVSPGVAPDPTIAAKDAREPRVTVPEVFVTGDIPASPTDLKHAPGKGNANRNYKLYAPHEPNAPKGSHRPKHIEKTIPAKGMIPQRRGKTLAELSEKERSDMDTRIRRNARDAESRAAERQASAAVAVRSEAKASLRDALGRERAALASGDVVAARQARADVRKYRKLSNFKGE